LPTASAGTSQAPTTAVDNSAPLLNRPQSTYKSGNAVQTSGATIENEVLACNSLIKKLRDDILKVNSAVAAFNISMNAGAAAGQTV
jgi:hypothetical protein